MTLTSYLGLGESAVSGARQRVSGKDAPLQTPRSSGPDVMGWVRDAIYVPSRLLQLASRGGSFSCADTSC